MNKTCVEKELTSWGMEWDDLTYNITSTNLTACSFTDKIRTPSDEYFRWDSLEIPSLGDDGLVSVDMVKYMSKF